MKVFISGPMKGYPNFNKEAFDQAEKELIQQGYTVFNPAWMDFSGEWTKQDKRAIDAAIMSRWMRKQWKPHGMCVCSGGRNDIFGKGCKRFLLCRK